MDESIGGASDHRSGCRSRQISHVGFEAVGGLEDFDDDGVVIGHEKGGTACFSVLCEKGCGGWFKAILSLESVIVLQCIDVQANAPFGTRRAVDSGWVELEFKEGGTGGCRIIRITCGNAGAEGI
jgi:hypothetical protein